MPDRDKLPTGELTPRKRSRASSPKGDVRIAAIDIGSNSIRQTVADVSPTGARHRMGTEAARLVNSCAKPWRGLHFVNDSYGAGRRNVRNRLTN